MSLYCVIICVNHSEILLRALLASLLLDGTGIPPAAFGVARYLKSNTRNLPPIYITHGTADDKVPHRQSKDVVAVLKEINAQFEYHEKEGLDHFFDKEPSCGMEDMYDFVQKLVKA
jgi:predicted esterase